jgi:polyphosphate kinase 2 (PPK2 family)
VPGANFVNFALMVDRDARFAPARGGADMAAALAALRDHLGELQLPQIAYGRRAMVLLEGADGAGKKFVLKQLAAAFDPCHFVVHSTPFDRRQENEGHWLARFWRQLPSAGNTSIFFRSWYRRALEDRVLGRTPEDTIPRVFDEINEFEAQQRDYGTLLVKLFFDVSADVQEQRLAQRRRSAWCSAQADDDFIRADDPAYQQSLDELRANTDTRWSPWRTIDADDEQHAALAALEAIAEAWSRAMPSQPPQPVSPRIVHSG